MTDFDKSKLTVCRLVGDASFKSRAVISESATHTWVTVVNPNNHRLLLQACDDCGVVKSENSVTKPCQARKGQALISSAMRANFRLVS